MNFMLFIFIFQVEGNFYVNDSLEKLMFEELRNACRGGGQLLFTCVIHRHHPHEFYLTYLSYSRCGRIPSSHETNRECGGAARNRSCEEHVLAAENVSTAESRLCSHLYLIGPQRSIGLPDVHSGYGFAIGNMAAFDMNDPDAVVSPGTCLTPHVWRCSQS